MKKFLLITFIFLGWLFTFPCLAQDQHAIDSLETLLKKLNVEKMEMRNNASSMADTNIVQLLYRLSQNHWYNNTAIATDYANQSLSLAEMIGYKKGVGKAYSSLGVINYLKGDYSPAIDYHKKALKIRIETNDKKAIASTYNNLGNIYTLQGNYTLALDNYFISLKIKEEIKDRQGIADAYVNIGNIYFNQRNYPEALKNYSMSLKMNEELGDKPSLANIYLNIANLYNRQGNYSKALNSHFKVLKIAEELSDKNTIGDCYNNMSVVYSKMGNYAEELKTCLAALKIREEIGDKDGIAGSNINLADIYIRNKKYKEAAICLSRSLSISKEIGSMIIMNQSYKYLTRLDSAQGNFKEAFEHHKLLIITRDSLDNTEKAKKSIALQMQYDFDKKEAAIKAQQDIKDALTKEEIQKEKTIKVAVVLGSGLLLMIMLLIINRRKATHNMQVNKLENKTLRAQLNPHFIFNALASIQKYMSEHPELAENYLAKFGKLMREVLENSEKEYISLEDEFSMLKKYMDLENLRVTNGFDYEVTIDATVDDETTQVPPLLFQPIIENAIWHGVANGKSKGKITIRAAIQNEILNIEIENQSNEVSVKRIETNETFQKKKSFGLQIVKERLALLSKEKRRKGNLQLMPLENGMKVAISILV